MRTVSTINLIEKWRHRIAVIRQAEIEKNISLADWERAFLMTQEGILEEGRELSFANSSLIGRIYARIQ